METASVALRRPTTEERSTSINVGGGVGRGFGASDGAGAGGSSVGSAGLRTASTVAVAWLMRVSRSLHEQSACQAQERATRSHAAICSSRAACTPKELRVEASTARVFLRAPLRYTAQLPQSAG